MKAILLIGAVLFSVSGQAQMAVGTWASYNLSMTFEGGTPFNGTEKVTALEVSGTKTLIESVQVYDGNTSVENEWQEDEELMTAEEGQMAIDNCTDSEIRGVVESVTVAAGTFTACKIGSEEDGIAWIGAVPYGWIKMAAHGEAELEDGTKLKVYMTRELTGFIK